MRISLSLTRGITRSMSTFTSPSHISHQTNHQRWVPFLSLTNLDRITLIRHAESLGNTGEESPQLIGDYQLNLSTRGKQQALDTGKRFGRSFFLGDTSRQIPAPLLYCSPYRRTRDTMKGLLVGSGVLQPDQTINQCENEVTEDVRLREVEFGYGAPSDLSIAEQERLRALHGWLFYRFAGGESPADAIERCGNFISSMHRQLCRQPDVKHVVIVTHGLASRCFLSRFFHLTVDQFDALENPRHCDPIDIVRGGQATSDASGRLLVTPHSNWGLRGVRIRDEWMRRATEWQTKQLPVITCQEDNHDTLDHSNQSINQSINQSVIDTTSVLATTSSSTSFPSNQSNNQSPAKRQKLSSDHNIVDCASGKQINLTL